MTKRRLTLREVADYDHGHHDPAHTSQFSIDSFDFKGRGDMKTRPVPGHYADNPMYDSSKLTEDGEDADALDRLHSMLTSAGVEDDEIAGGARLTPEGTQKVAAKLGVADHEVDLLLNSLAERVRKSREEDLQVAFEATMGTRARYTAEEDYLGNMTVRDAKTGHSKFLRGSDAADIKRRAKAEGDQGVLASVFENAKKGAIRAERAFPDVYRLLDGSKIVGLAMRMSNKRWMLTDPDEKRIGSTTYGSPKEAAAAWKTPVTESQSSEWPISSGPVTYNFPWERDGEHGTATAKFDGNGPDAEITIVQARDSRGKRVEIDGALRAHLESEARDFIGQE